MGHPANVVFYSSRTSQVSPIVNCYLGGGALERDLRRVMSDAVEFGASELAVDLAVRWAVEYGKHYVNLYNLNAPGLTAGMSEAEVYRASLAFARSEAASSDEWWVLVDIDELRAVSERGVWEMGE